MIGILYRPPDQSKFLDKLSTAISETDNFDAQEVYILGDLNINLINNQKHTPNEIKRYKEFCSLNGLKQLLTLPTLYKKEAKTKPKNYRPISLLPLISKIIERIIHDQTQVFLDENKILFTYQSGFQKHYSTDTCLSYLTDRV